MPNQKMNRLVFAFSITNWNHIPNKNRRIVISAFSKHPQLHLFS